MASLVPADNEPNDEVGSQRRMKGMRIRDEFLCPITYDLLREPVVASDGHTYEKMAIEKWLKSENPTSPLSGERLHDKEIVHNRTLKKLIQDLINEGGLGLYTTDSSGDSRIFDVYTERVLVLKCVGPPEVHDWYLQSFQCGPRGVFGGRKPRGGEAAAATFSATSSSQETVLFRDANVSRAHFDIKLLSPGNYGIRDLGSSGGTYIRIVFTSSAGAADKGRELHAGMIIMIGKHQFTVSSIDDSGIAINNNNVSNGGGGGQRRDHDEAKAQSKDDESTTAESGGGGGGEDSEAEMLHSVIADAEMLVNRLAEQRKRLEGPASDERASRKVSSPDGRGKGGTTARSKRGEDEDAAKEMEQYLREISSRLEGLKQRAGEAADGEDGGGGGDSKMPEVSGGGAKVAANSASTRKEPFADRRCRLTCCAPEGSPLIGKSFVIGPKGATLGRRNTNDISLNLKSRADGSQDMVPVDTAVSAEHAHIVMDGSSGRFHIHDGDREGKKGSTNGSWYRLSGPNQESAYHPLRPGMEILVTNIRFGVSEETTVLEKNVTAGAGGSAGGAAAALDSGDAT